MKKIISIVGPTAIGKTALAIQLASYFSTEIMSTDSRQFYREMSIGTAKPNVEELEQVPHHFINSLSIHDSYSVGQFERDAISLSKQLFTKHSIVIAVGGSGLFDKAFLYGLDDFPEVDASIRTELNALFEEKGIEELQNQLKTLDETYYHEVDLHNHQRIIRALEICIGTGQSFSSFRNETTQKREFEFMQIGCTAPREIIYERINSRVNQMMEKGLLQEAENLYPFRYLNALNTVGYKELFAFLDKEISLDFAIEEIQKNTRRFAKRQLTWYQKQPNIHWLENPNVEEILKKI